MNFFVEDKLCMNWKKHAKIRSDEQQCPKSTELLNGEEAENVKGDRDAVRRVMWAANWVLNETGKWYEKRQMKFVAAKMQI